MGCMFSVGDKVVVVGCTLGGHSSAYNFQLMPAYNECVTEITHVYDSEYTLCPYVIEADGGRFIWSEEWLRPYEEEDVSVMTSASESDILSFLCGR